MEGAEVRRRARARAVYLDLVAGVSDASRLSQIEDLATLLYAVQLALVLFWLQDLSSEVQKTVHLLTFVHDPVARTRPLLRLPWVTQTLAQLVQIIGPLLGRGENVLVE